MRKSGKVSISPHIRKRVTSRVRHIMNAAFLRLPTILRSRLTSPNFITAKILASRLSHMPPKRTVSSSSKRKASSSDSDEGAGEQSQSKKAKVDVKKKATTADVPEGFSVNGQPTNKVLPVHIEFPPKNAGTIRIATWNVSGLAASQKKVYAIRRPCYPENCVNDESRASNSTWKLRIQTC